MLAYHTVSPDPIVLWLPVFVSAAEADHLIGRAEDGFFARSRIVCTSPDGCVDPRRTSSSATLSPDAVTERIQERARAFSGLSNCEALQVVRYRPGQEFQPHLDQFDPRAPDGWRSIHEGGGQRAATFLVYLNEPAAGGETVFPALGFGVTPVRGSAVFWHHQSRTGGGQTDTRTLHGGAPVRRGVKYAANVWLRHGRPPVR